MNYQDLYTGDDIDIAISGNIAADTIIGLSSIPKFLLPKYFYDQKGSAIFRSIMQMPEYYLTRTENEILNTYATDIVKLISVGESVFSIIEPGSGDGSKTILLLKEFLQQNARLRYMPVDISVESNEILKVSINELLPGIEIYPVNGDYYHIPLTPGLYNEGRRVILFLGSNIGNLNNSELNRFLGNISDIIHREDKVLIGFDLKKSPSVIVKAYDDPHGLTREFNFNLLLRLNRELNADFDTSVFEHHTEYNPVSGELKSFLVSNADHDVHIESVGETFHFSKWEPVFMELSRKFDIGTIETIAKSHGFRIERNFTDRSNWFVDSLWTRI